MLRAPYLVALLLSAVTSLSASRALAQAPAERTEDATRIEAAERAFARGEDAANELRWADSETAFREAYELSHAVSALFNRALALRALGRHLEARNSFREVIARTDADAALRESATELEAQSSARVGALRLEGLEAHPSVELRIDTMMRTDDGARPLHLECDEGERTLRVDAEGFESFEWSGTVAPGAPTVIDVLLQPIPSGGNVLEEPWLWIVIGAVVVAAGAITAYVVYEDAQLSTETAVRFTL